MMEGKMMDGKMTDSPMMMGKACKCQHHSMMPILVVLFGALFLLGELGVFTMQVVSWVWPILVIVAGLMKWMGRGCKCC